MSHLQRQWTSVDDGSGLARGNQILPVADLPLDFDGVPVDGAQYLAVVRKESRSAPSVVRHSSYIDRSDECPPQKQPGALQPNTVPSQEWRTCFLANFGNMRRSLENRHAPDGGAALGIPQVRNPSKWFYFVYGRSSDHQSGTINAEAQLSPPTSREPSPSLLQHFYPKQILALLEAITLWIEEDWKPLGVQSDESGSIINHQHNSRWIFALLAHLDDQLVGDDISTLRSLARSCLAQVVEGRKGREAGGLSLEEESGAWIAICAVAGIWAQHDLWGEAVDLLSR